MCWNVNGHLIWTWFVEVLYVDQNVLSERSFVSHGREVRICWLLFQTLDAALIHVVEGGGRGGRGGWIDRSNAVWLMYGSFIDPM